MRCACADCGAKSRFLRFWQQTNCAQSLNMKIDVLAYDAEIKNYLSKHSFDDGRKHLDELNPNGFPEHADFSYLHVYLLEIAASLRPHPSGVSHSLKNRFRIFAHVLKLLAFAESTDATE